MGTIVNIAKYPEALRIPDIGSHRAPVPEKQQKTKRVGLWERLVFPLVRVVTADAKQSASTDSADGVEMLARVAGFGESLGCRRCRHVRFRPWCDGAMVLRKPCRWN